MKKIQIAGFTALTLLGSLTAVQAQTATTAPVGYITLPSIPANGDVRIGVPMEASVDFTGLAASFELNVLTVTGAAFTADEFLPDDGGYFLRIKSGPSAGQTAEITANTTDTLTLALEAGDDLTDVDATTQIEIVKYFTLSTFFTNTLPDGTEILFYDNQDDKLNKAPATTLLYNGGKWYNRVGFAEVDASLYPGDSFILRNNDASPITDIVITGNVPTVSHRVVLNAVSGSPQDFMISFLSPIAQTIGSTGLGFADGDEFLVYDNTTSQLNKAPATTLLYNSGSWYNRVGFANVDDTFMLEPGVGYIYRKAAGASGGNTWDTVQTYNQ